MVSCNILFKPTKWTITVDTRSPKPDPCLKPICHASASCVAAHTCHGWAVMGQFIVRGKITSENHPNSTKFHQKLESNRIINNSINASINNSINSHIFTQESEKNSTKSSDWARPGATPAAWLRVAEDVQSRPRRHPASRPRCFWMGSPKKVLKRLGISWFNMV